MGEQTQTEDVERTLDSNAYHVLAMLFAPVVTKAFQYTAKRSEAKLDRYCDCMKAEINGRRIHLSPVEMMTGDLENKNLNTII